jgi:hypothetical protein
VRRFRVWVSSTLTEIELPRALGSTDPGLLPDVPGLVARIARYEIDDVVRAAAARGHHVDDLKARLLAALNRLLTSDQNYRHRAQVRIRRPCREVQRTGAQSADAYARVAGEPAMAGGHERRGLLMAGDDQLNARRPQ